MGFLPIIYVGFYLFIALAVYVCFSVVAERDALGKKLFWAVLAFGACSAIGYVAISIAVSSIHSLRMDQLQAPFVFAAYIVPGLLGGWLMTLVLGKLKRKRNSKTPPNSST